MVEHKFNNECDIILYGFSYLLNRFEQKHQLFAVQCIWCLASITRFTETLMFYQHYRIFTSDYLGNLVVTPLDKPLKPSVSESDSSELELQLDNSQLHWESDTNHHPSSIKCELAEARSIPPVDQKIRSGRIVKPVNHSNKELQKRYPRRNKKQLQCLWAPIKKDGLIV